MLCCIIAGARQVFERWMEWEPEEQAWHSYINFELRYKELDRARVIYERYILYLAMPIAKLPLIVINKFVQFCLNFYISSA